MYEPRKYRELMEGGRFYSFNIIVEETDIWVGLGKSKVTETVVKDITNYISLLRKELKDYIRSFPSFLESHEPVDVLDSDTDNILLMKRACIRAGTGPMASVAGFFAFKVLKYLEIPFPAEEIIVENGGDLYIKMEDTLIINPFPVQNRYFSGFALEMEPVEKYLSVCSSSGMFGHSFSYGKADLVSVISSDACLADAWATSLANKVNDVDDVEKVSSQLPSGILAILAIKDDRMGYKGPFKFLRT